MNSRSNGRPSLSVLFWLGCLLTLVFLGMDSLWQAGLRTLGLSYGPRWETGIAYFILRSGLLVFWLIVLLAFYPRRSRTQRYVYTGLLALAHLALLAASLYGFYIEPFHLTVSKISLPVNGLQKPIRIVQLSDLHVERTTPREAQIPGLVASLKPDLIVLTGDYINEAYTNNQRAIDALRALLGQLSAPLGVYAINGNVESPFRMAEDLNGLNIRLLDDEIVPVPGTDNRLALLGLSFYEWRDNDKALERLKSQAPAGSFTILLYHKPDVAYTARDVGVNLYLAGHTHGGQVRLPLYGAIFTNSRYGKTFEMGEYHLGNTTLFVSRGLGFTAAPHVRFLAPPEVVVVDLLPAP